MGPGVRRDDDSEWLLTRRALLQLLDVAGAVNDDGHFLPILDGPERFDLAGWDLPDLLIARGFKLGENLILRQRVRGRGNRSHSQQTENRRNAFSHPHDPISPTMCFPRILEQQPP
jgi:hypothetical protein